MNKLKITVDYGYEDAFMEFCEDAEIPCRQYPHKELPYLRNRFSVEGKPETFEGMSFIQRIEDMPTGSLDDMRDIQ